MNSLQPLIISPNLCYKKCMGISKENLFWPCTKNVEWAARSKISADHCAFLSWIGMRVKITQTSGNEHPACEGNITFIFDCDHVSLAEVLYSTPIALNCLAEFRPSNKVENSKYIRSDFSVSGCKFLHQTDLSSFLPFMIHYGRGEGGGTHAQVGWICTTGFLKSWPWLTQNDSIILAYLRQNKLY